MSKLVRAIFKIGGSIGHVLLPERGAFPPAPELEAFLVGDAEEPAAEFGVLAQAGDVADGGNEGLLDNVQACLLVADHLEDINIQRQLVAAKQSAPSLRISGFGLRHGQYFQVQPRPALTVSGMRKAIKSSNSLIHPSVGAGW